MGGADVAAAAPRRPRDRAWLVRLDWRLQRQGPADLPGYSVFHLRRPNTQGLFRYSRHPNYRADLLSLSGMCLISGAWITAAIPVLMLAGFVFVNIPVLDAHLHDHYGTAFDEYARRTRKLILVY